MCTVHQLDVINKKMTECYYQVYGDSVEDIFLYGSYARGDYDSESDIDFAAVVRGNRVELQQKLKVVWNMSAALGLENDVVISPIVIPYDEFMKYQDILPYYNHIVMEGKLLLYNDKRGFPM